MKRKLTAGVVVALAASVWIAPATSASQSISCDPGAPPEGGEIVWIGDGQIKLYPANATGYAVGMVGWIRANANCVVEESVAPLATCVATLVANRPTVTIDPETLETTIDYGGTTGTECENPG